MEKRKRRKENDGKKRRKRKGEKEKENLVKKNMKYMLNQIKTKQSIKECVPLSFAAFSSRLYCLM